jgi:sugar lactone lactonase YvrE
MLNNKISRFAIRCGIAIAASFVLAGCTTGNKSTSTPSPTLFVSDGISNRIVQIPDLNIALWAAFGTLGNGVGQFNRPTSIFVDSQGRLFVADSNNNRIVRVDGIAGANWTALSQTSVGGLVTPHQAITDAQGRIYIVDSGNNRVVRVDDMTGANAVAFPSAPFPPGPPVDPLALNVPTGIALDSQGRIYIVDSGNSRIVRIDDINGTNRVDLGTSGIGTNQFSLPMGIFIDVNNLIYVTDTGNNRVVRFNDITGTGWTQLGALGDGINQFNSPSGIFVDPQLRIYITDTGNGRVIRADDMSGHNWFPGIQNRDANHFSQPLGIY